MYFGRSSRCGGAKNTRLRGREPRKCEYACVNERRVSKKFEETQMFVNEKEGYKTNKGEAGERKKETQWLLFLDKGSGSD